MNTTPSHLTRYELSRLIEELAAMIECSTDGMVLDHEVKDTHPILAAIKMFRELRPNTFEVHRTLIPGDPSTVEIFDPAKMTYDEIFLRETEEFLIDGLINRELLTSKRKNIETPHEEGMIEISLLPKIEKTMRE